MPDFKDFLAPDPNNEPPAVPTPPAEEPTPEPKKEEPEKTPEPNPEVKQILETVNELGETIKSVSEKVEEVAGKVDEFNKPEPAAPAPKESWEPQGWDDFPKLAEEKAKEIAEKTFEEKEAARKAEEEAATNEEKQREEYIEGQVVELEKAGKVPEVKDINDAKDPGRAARRELFGLATKTGSIDLKGTFETLEKMHEAGYKFDFTGDPRAGTFVKTGKPAIGKTAPVGNSAAGGANEGDKPSYKDIHEARDLNTLAKKFGG